MTSVVVTVAERPVELDRLYRAYADVLEREGQPFEFIFVFQPWHAPLAGPLLTLQEGGAPIRVLF